jgi:hypothetical protein
MTHTISRQPHTAEAWVRSRFSPCKIFGGKSGTWKRSNIPPRVLRFAPVNVIPPMIDTHLHLLINTRCPYQEDQWEKPGILQNATVFRKKRGTLGSKVLTLFLVFYMVRWPRLLCKNSNCDPLQNIYTKTPPQSNLPFLSITVCLPNCTFLRSTTFTC